MMDLEKVLPTGVQVTSIEPGISKDGDVTIRLRVSGDRERTVQFVRNLETSQRFLQPRLSSEQAQTQEANHTTTQVLAPGAVQFEILSGYNPLPAKGGKEGLAKTEGDGTQKASSTGATRNAATRRSPTGRPGVVKAPAQKGAPR
jgi:type IV pilus assembly protein PilN